MRISITLKRQEIVNDVYTACNVIARTMRKNPEAEESAGEIMTPDDPLTKPLVARSLTEAFGEVKSVCQAYMLFGRFTDDNRLEKIDDRNSFEEEVKSSPVKTDCKYRFLTGIPYVITVISETDVKVMDEEGTILARGTEMKFDHTPVRTDEYLTLESESVTNVQIHYKWGDFGKYELLMEMPNRFNPSITETIKSYAHKLMVDYTVSQVLKDQYTEKANEYAQQFALDKENLRKSLVSRMAYGRPYAADWS